MTLCGGGGAGDEGVLGRPQRPTAVARFRLCRRRCWRTSPSAWRCTAEWPSTWRRTRPTTASTRGWVPRAERATSVDAPRGPLPPTGPTVPPPSTASATASTSLGSRTARFTLTLTAARARDPARESAWRPTLTPPGPVRPIGSRGGGDGECLRDRPRRPRDRRRSAARVGEWPPFADVRAESPTRAPAPRAPPHTTLTHQPSPASPITQLLITRQRLKHVLVRQLREVLVPLADGRELHGPEEADHVVGLRPHQVDCCR